uniref:ubiquitinyl hydrolase 1 n=1 Tax=Leptobrachium leishanense TaxID=445787 RepID=A0A8C5QPV3_9ANUR
MSESVFHERQRLELCAVHALNNLLQRPEISQQLAEDICRGLAPDSMINPHRSFLGTGNYDVNVIMAALQTLDYAAVWWDKRKAFLHECISRGSCEILLVVSKDVEDARLWINDGQRPT